MKNILHRPLFWLISFAIIFLLTQDFLFPAMRTKPYWLGLPNWLYCFMAIHTLFVLTFYFFIKKYWK